MPAQRSAILTLSVFVVPFAAANSRFRDIGPRSKASGFEENLNFGLGVNRMTPGQKNVLIFGSLALGFAFFLSLYSLR